MKHVHEARWADTQPQRAARGAWPELPGCVGDCAQGRYPCARPIECGTAREEHDSWLDAEIEAAEDTQVRRLALDLVATIAMVAGIFGVIALVMQVW